MMADIDYILDLLDWNRTEEEQAEGLRLARQVKAFNVFLQPCDKKNNKMCGITAPLLSLKRRTQTYLFICQIYSCGYRT